MGSLTSQMMENIKSQQVSEQKQKVKFINRLSSYWHVPSNQKEVNKMLPFAQQLSIVDFVLDNLTIYGYPQEITFDVDFDIIGYWYCLALLMVSDDKNAHDFVLDLIDRFIDTEHDDLWQFRRILNYIDNDIFKQAKVEVESYFLSREKTLESYKWAQDIGLELPSNDKWGLEFCFDTQGEYIMKSDIPCEEKNVFFQLRVSVYPLDGCGGSLTAGNCYRIEFDNLSRTVRGNWSLGRDKTLTVDINDDYYKIIDVNPSLIHLKDFIKELEDIFEFKFNRTIVTKSFHGGIKNKNAVQKWLRR